MPNRDVNDMCLARQKIDKNLQAFKQGFQELGNLFFCGNPFQRIIIDWGLYWASLFMKTPEYDGNRET